MDDPHDELGSQVAPSLDDRPGVPKAIKPLGSQGEDGDQPTPLQDEEEEKQPSIEGGSKGGEKEMERAAPAAPNGCVWEASSSPSSFSATRRVKSKSRGPSSRSSAGWWTGSWWHMSSSTPSDHHASQASTSWEEGRWGPQPRHSSGATAARSASRPRYISGVAGQGAWRPTPGPIGAPPPPLPHQYLPRATPCGHDGAVEPAADASFSSWSWSEEARGTARDAEGADAGYYSAAALRRTRTPGRSRTSYYMRAAAAAEQRDSAAGGSWAGSSSIATSGGGAESGAGASTASRFGCGFVEVGRRGDHEGEEEAASAARLLRASASSSSRGGGGKGRIGRSQSRPRSLYETARVSAETMAAAINGWQ